MFLELGKILLAIYGPVFAFLLLQEPLGNIGAALVFGPLLMFAVVVYGSYGIGDIDRGD